MSENNRVLYFDGMRGLAILLVGLGHVFVEVNMFKIGWIGLNLFFILSGFLITQRLYHHGHENRTNYFKKFFVRRALRILPLYFAILLFYFFLLPLVYKNYDTYFLGIKHSQLWYWLFLSNWWMIGNGLPQSPDLFHFWSLAVEEQFYICWPVFFLLLRSAPFRLYIVLALIVGCALFRISQTASMSTYLNTFTAAEPLLLGCFICICCQMGILDRLFAAFAVAAVCAVLGLSVIFLNDSRFDIANPALLKYGYSFINILFAFCLVVCGLGKRSSTMMQHLFSAKWLTWLGRYSYGIYVFHWILLKLFAYKVENYLLRQPLLEGLSYLVPRLLVIVVCLVLSYWSYHLYEHKFMKLKTHFA